MSLPFSGGMEDNASPAHRTEVKEVEKEFLEL